MRRTKDRLAQSMAFALVVAGAMTLALLALCL